MKAMIFAAGLGTRLRPLTDRIPKALVPVGGSPMLEHVILKLKEAGFDEIVINIHHLGEQILDFLRENHNFGVDIHISDERDLLLDTGGGIWNARQFFEKDNEPFLIHNVDILSNVDLRKFYEYHCANQATATLLVSQRVTSRYLLFDDTRRLHGWINKKTGETKPSDFHYREGTFDEFAFAGIHMMSPAIFRLMDAGGWKGVFPIIEFYLSVCREAKIQAYVKEQLKLIDIGKPETLKEAENFLKTI